MPENWYDREEAAQRLETAAAAVKGEALSESEKALIPFILAELMGWCHIESVPEGALWPAAEELLRRGSGMSGSGGAVSKLTLGDYSVSFGAGTGAGNGGWVQGLTAWRRMRF